jgi:tRNA G18 (ribose-2'-O)-methylase SpoU
MFRKLSTHQLNRLTFYQYKHPVTLLLDNVRSMHNVGSIFRSADCFGVQKMVLGGITGKPPHKEIHKTALGAEDSVPWVHIDDLKSHCLELKNKGVVLIAVEQTENSTHLGEFALDENREYAIILGNEVDGVSQDLLDICDLCIEIPQFGTKHSFNVSVCASIVLWDLLIGKNKQ